MESSWPFHRGDSWLGRPALAGCHGGHWRLECGRARAAHPTGAQPPARRLQECDDSILLRACARTCVRCQPGHYPDPEPLTPAPAPSQATTTCTQSGSPGLTCQSQPLTSTRCEPEPAHASSCSRGHPTGPQPPPTLPRMPTFTLGLTRNRTLTRTRWEPDCEEQDDVPSFLHSDGVRRR